MIIHAYLFIYVSVIYITCFENMFLWTKTAFFFPWKFASKKPPLLTNSERVCCGLKTYVLWRFLKAYVWVLSGSRHMTKYYCTNSHIYLHLQNGAKFMPFARKIGFPKERPFFCGTAFFEIFQNFPNIWFCNGNIARPNGDITRPNSDITRPHGETFFRMVFFFAKKTCPYKNDQKLCLLEQWRKKYHMEDVGMYIYIYILFIYIYIYYIYMHTDVYSNYVNTYFPTHIMSSTCRT